ncbi:MAG: MBL fold metallo-hydrolase [Balneolaceae bacterium]|nr:MBL fold metallo-hydrolase [Balneolaceae bacterium]
MPHIYTLFFFVFSLSLTSCAKANHEQKNTKAQSEDIQYADFIHQQITHNLHVFKSPDYNTNAGVFIGAETILLIDPMTGRNNHENLLSAIRQLSDKPISYVINTHSHGDHSGANSFFKEQGASIISQDNAKYSSAVTDITFNDTYSINMGNETIELYHIAAHTLDDALIYFKNSNAIFMGDTYMTDTTPHFYYGGGSKGHQNILNKALTLGDENTIIVPAHGKQSSNKPELQDYLQNSIQWIERIKKLYNVGMSASEISTDAQIEQLARAFNLRFGVSSQSIEKTISIDLMEEADISEAVLKQYEGTYEYEGGNTAEILIVGGDIVFRSEGGYIYKLRPISEDRFQLKGQLTDRYVSLQKSGSKLVFFNGRQTLTAQKR